MKDLYVKLIVAIMMLTVAIISWQWLIDYSPVQVAETQTEEEPKVAQPQRNKSTQNPPAKKQEITPPTAQPKPQTQADEQDLHALGENAVNNMESVFLAEIGFLFEDDSNNASLLKEGKLKELFIEALSNPESPDSHFYMGMVDFKCSINGSGYETDIPPNYEDLASAEFDEIDGQQRRFYEGYNAGLVKSHLRLNTECREIALLKENNQDFIKRSLKESFGKDSFMELLQSVLEDEDSSKAFFSKTSIKPTPLLQKAVAIESGMKSKDSDEKDKAYLAMVEESLANPDFYLTSRDCSYKRRCKEIIGEEKYIDYLKNGAHLGSRGTLRKYTQELIKASKTAEALAWGKYQQDLLRNGCSISSLVFEDMRLTKDIKKLQTELSEEESQQSESLYLEIKNNHFKKATQKLGCNG